MSQATPTSSSSTATAPIGAAADPLTATVFGRYRVMAFITGGFLLLLCAEMILRYVFKLDWVKDVFGWVPFVHGWVYIVYAITCLMLWSKARWGFGKLAIMILGGVIPVLSFVVEAKSAKWPVVRRRSAAGATSGAEITAAPPVDGMIPPTP